MANSLISMIKGDSTLIDNTEVLDGQILFNTDDKTILLDDGDEREQYGGKSDTANPNIAYVEEGTTATRGYAKGQYVIVSGILYKALVQINSGTTFVVNTNIEQTTVGTELGRTITREAYDLLPASEKNKGIWYITNSGDSYHVDNALSTTSTNPVQNKIITTEINKINADLSDNNKSFKFGYDSENDQYGYYKEEAGADTFVPFKSGGGAVLIGTYNANTSIDVSSYSATSIDQFLVVTSSNNSGSYLGYVGDVTSPHSWTYFYNYGLTLTDNTLTLTVPRVTTNVRGGRSGMWAGDINFSIPCDLYFIG